MSTQVLYHIHPTPLGALRLAAHNSGLVEAVFLDSPATKNAKATQGSNPTRDSRAKSRQEIPHLGNKQYLYAQYQRQKHKELAASTHLENARAALDKYFSGDTTVLSSVKLAPQGTEFQQLIWAGLQRIPFGEVKNYSDLADDVERPKAIRAAGTACKSNPIILFIPCHRVIGKNQTLTGFNGGLERKAFLLQHEGLRVASASEPSASEPQARSRTKVEQTKIAHAA